jgi:hypothetical protein
VLALPAAALAAALAAAPAVPTADHATRPYQRSLEGRKGVAAPPSSVTQRYVLALPGSPRQVTGRPASYGGRDDPAPAGEPAPPSPGMIVLVAMLALVGAGAVLVAPQWLRDR